MSKFLAVIVIWGTAYLASAAAGAPTDVSVSYAVLATLGVGIVSFFDLLARR